MNSAEDDEVSLFDALAIPRDAFDVGLPDYVWDNAVTHALAPDTEADDDLVPVIDDARTFELEAPSDEIDLGDADTVSHWHHADSHAADSPDVVDHVPDDHDSDHEAPDHHVHHDLGADDAPDDSDGF